MLRFVCFLPILQNWAGFLHLFTGLSAKAHTLQPWEHWQGPRHGPRQGEKDRFGKVLGVPMGQFGGSIDEASPAAHGRVRAS